MLKYSLTIVALLFALSAHAKNVPGYSRLSNLYNCTYRVTKAWNAAKPPIELVPTIVDVCSGPIERIESVDPHFTSLTNEVLNTPMVVADLTSTEAQRFIYPLWSTRLLYPSATIRNPQLIEAKLQEAAKARGF